MSPYANPDERKASKRDWEAKRHKSYTRLRIALRVLEEYGLIWAYELECDAEGIDNPRLVPEPRKRSAA